MKKTQEDGLRPLERFIFEEMADSNLPGLSIAAIKDGSLFYKRGFGFRDLKTGASATPDSLFCIGSVTKSFTCLAIMQLQERGLLNIDEPIGEYVPLSLEPMGEPIAIKHLMSHTSGIPALGYAEASLSRLTRKPDRWLPISNVEDMLTFMGGVGEWVQSRPGERWFYLNEGYILLGSVIEEASGESYADYIKKHILRPLKMNRSTFEKEDVEGDPDVATPHATGEGGERIPAEYPYGEMLSDGGLMSSVDEMSNYLEMLLAYGEFENHRVASPESIRAMIEPKIRTPEEPLEGRGHTFYGYGFRVKSDFFGLDLVHHSGSVYVSSAYLGFVPEERVGVVVLTNAGYFLQSIGEYALALLMDEDPMEVLALRRARILDDLTGNYQAYGGTMNFKVTRNGGVLQLEMRFGKRAFTTPLMPVSIEEETKVFNVLGIDYTTPVEFIEKDKETIMVYERYKLKRISDL